MGLTASQALFWDQTWLVGGNNGMRMDFTTESLGGPYNEFFCAFLKNSLEYILPKARRLQSTMANF